MFSSKALRVLLGGAAVFSAAVLPPTSGVAAEPGPVDVAAQAGIGITSRTWSANTGDFDRDGDADWLLVRHNPQLFWFGTGQTPDAVLYENTEPSVGTHVFDPVQTLPAPAGSGSDRHDCDFADVNADDRTDLFCAVGLDDDSTNEVWIQDSAHAFVNSTQGFGLDASPSAGNYRTTTFIRANPDPYPDVYVTRYYGPDGAPLNDPAEDPPEPNELWLNQNGEGFQRAPDSLGLNRPIGAQKDTPGCTQAADYDDDGDPDLLVCGYKQMKLYRNDGATFTDATTPAIAGFYKDAQLVDLGGSSRLDLVQLKAKTLVVKLWNGRRFSASYSSSLSAGETLASGDFEGDGDNDLYVVRTCASGANQPDLNYLNSGSGTAFSRLQLAAGVAGCGNTVERIDYNGDGRDDFIVLNGKQKKEGPVQLYTWR